MSCNFKNKRSAISLETKIKILDRLDGGVGSTAVGKEFGLGESTIRVIKKNEDAIRDAVVAGTNLGARKSSYSRGIHKVRMEKALVLYLEDLAQKKIPVDGNLIKRHALRIYKEMRDVEPASVSHQRNNSAFSASTGWLTGFLKRYGFRHMKMKDEGDETATVDKTTAVDETTLVDEAPSALTGTLADGTTSVPEAGAEKWPEKSESTENTGQVSTETTVKEERAPITADLILTGLQLASQLESYFLENDTDFGRALKFQQELRCCIADYRELYKGLVNPVPESSIAEVSEREIIKTSPSRFDGLTIASDNDLKPGYKWMREFSDSENSRISEDENI